MKNFEQEGSGERGEGGISMDNFVEKFLLKMRISRDEFIEAMWKSF